MADAEVWRRRRGVSKVRGAVVVGWFAVATTLAALLIVPAVWSIPVGAVLDHHLSRYGALALALAGGRRGVRG